MEDIDLSYLAKELFFLQSNIEKYQVDLRKNLSEVDEEICDIMHFVELYERDNEQSLELMDKLLSAERDVGRLKMNISGQKLLPKYLTAEELQTF